MKNDRIKRISLNNLIISSLFCLNLSWTTPLTISESGINYDPHVSSNDNNHSIVVWVNGVYPDLKTHYSLYDGVGWSEASAIDNTGAQVSPVSGIDSSGNVIALWESISENERSIVLALKPLNKPWEKAVTLSTSNLNTSPSLSVNAYGEVIAGWIDIENDRVQVVFLSFDGSWSAVNTISASGGNKINLCLGLDGNGNSIVAWEEHDSGNIFISQTTEGFNSSWSTPTCLTSNGKNSTPVISLNIVGNAIISWINIETYEVMASIYENNIWSQSSTISNNFGYLQTVMSLDNNYFVSWMDMETGDYMAARNNYSVWGSPVNLSNADLNGSSGLYAFFTAWTDKANGEIKIAEYPTTGDSLTPVELECENVNFSPKISYSPTMITSVWESVLEKDHIIQVSINK